MATLATRTVTIVRPSEEGEPLVTRTFVMSPLSIWTSNALNKNLLALLGPALAGIEMGVKGGKATFNPGRAAEVVSRVLGDMTDEKYQSLFSSLFSTTVWLPEGLDAQLLGAGPQSLKDAEVMDRAFERDLEGMFKLAVEVMEYNRFPFFARIAKAGKGILAMLTSSDTTKNEEQPTQQ